MRKLAVDFDDTLWPLHEFVASSEEGRQRVNLKKCLTYHTVIEQLGEPLWKELHLRALNYETMQRMGCFPGAAEALQALKDAGVAVTILTARPDGHLQSVRKTLKDESIPYEKVISRSAVDKVKYCLAHDLRVLVEDREDTIEAAIEAGISVVAPHKWYNRKTVTRLGVPHAESWLGLLPLIETALDAAYAA